MSKKKSKKIFYDFFQIDSSEGADKVHEIFLHQDRFKPIFDGINPIKIYRNIDRVGDLYAGVLIKCQMDDLNPSFNPNNNKLKNLPLGDEEGLGFTKCFLFDRKTNILMIESTKNISLNKFFTFFEFNSGHTLTPAIVLDVDAETRYRGFNYISKFEVKVAKIENGHIFEEEQSFDSIAKLANETDATKLDYTISCNRGRSLHVGTLRKFISRISPFKETEVQKLIVTGREEDDEKSVSIDFIKNRLRVPIEYDLDRHMSVVFINSKLKKMKEAYLQIKDTLDDVYALEEEAK